MKTLQTTRLRKWESDWPNDQIQILTTSGETLILEVAGATLDRMLESRETWREHVKTRLEYLREVLRAEQVSYGDLVELRNLAAYIEPGDTELLEAAGVPEFSA